MRIKNLYLSAISFVLAILVFVVSGALIKNDGHGMGIAAIFVGLAIVAVAVLALLNFIFGKKDNFILIPLLALFVTLVVFSTVVTLSSSSSSTTSDDTTILQLMIFALSVVSLVFATRNKKWASICGLVVVLLTVYSSAALIITSWGKIIEINQSATSPSESATLAYRMSACLALIPFMGNLIFLFYYIFNLVFGLKKAEAKEQSKSIETTTEEVKEVTNEQ